MTFAPRLRTAGFRSGGFAALIGALVLVAGCEVVTGPGDSLNVRVEQGTIELTNATGRHAYYFVVNTDMLPLINWAQCVGENCSGVAAGERVSLALEAPLRDGGESGMLTIYWWHAVSGPDGPRPGPLRIRTRSVR